jgi:hypothetical protein
MRVLYVIFVLCVGALVWAAFAVTRHIRRHEGEAARVDPEPQTGNEVPQEERKVLLAAHDSKND